MVAKSWMTSSFNNFLTLMMTSSKIINKCHELMLLILSRPFECSNTFRNVISSKNDSKYIKKLQTKISPFKFSSTYQVIKNGCCLQKNFSHQNVPKLILGKVIKFQKVWWKTKKLADKRLRRGVYWTPPLPKIGRFKEGNGFFSSIC